MNGESNFAFFRVLNRFMLWMWRHGMARLINIWPAVFGRIMVISHTGRVSGLKRQNPLNYAIVDGELYCMAGVGNRAQWYRNLMVRPEVEVWLPNERWSGCAEDITDRPDYLHLFREVAIASGFAAPLFGGFFPTMISDEYLAQMVKNCRLIHIERARPPIDLDMFDDDLSHHSNLPVHREREQFIRYFRPM